MKYACLIFALLLFEYTSGQTWSKVSLPSHLTLSHAVFWQDTGIVISPDGYIFHTLDFGDTWNIDSSLLGNTLQDIDFVSRSTGYISSPLLYGGVFKTQNGGTSWNVLPLSNFTGDIGSAIDFVSSEIGYGVHYLDGGCQFTQTGGETWSYTSLGSGCKQVFSIHFVNDSTGFALGSTSIAGGVLHLYKTSDYSVSWQPLGSLNIPAEGDFFVKDSTIIVVSSFSIKKSSNLGNTFTEVMHVIDPENSFTNNTPQAITFYNDTGYVAFLRNVYRTVDGGENWIKTSLNCDIDVEINFIYAVSGKKVIVGCNNGVLYKTETGGGVWSDVKGIKEQEQIAIYPNPTNNTLTLSIPNFQQPLKVSITNTNGQLMETEEMASANHTLNVASLPKGMYFVTVAGVQGRWVKKFVKQ